jgi:N-acetylmuramoyl-L-alanine amidase
MTLRIIERPSPNHDVRGAPVDMLVLHYTGMKTAEEALARLCDPAAKVSAHYTIDRDGSVYAHVPEERRAWHAGASHWAGRDGVNGCSIGIELVNPGHEFGYVPFTDEQIASLVALAQGILKRHTIAARHVLGHSDVAPSRKTDPGELFPWKHLAKHGIGLWPAARSAKAPEGADFAAALARFGYGVPPAVDVPLEAVIAAFQRHFRPSCINGVADGECAAILKALLAA